MQKLPFNQRIVIRANKSNCPIKRSASLLSSYIGVTARTSTLCPLNYTDWRRVPATIKRDAIAYIKEKFLYPPSIDSWVNYKLSKHWRDFKSELKAQYFNAELSESENCKETPEDVDPQQRKFLVHYFLSDEGKALAKKGRDSRQLQKVKHSCGSKAFAIRLDEMEEEAGGPVGAFHFYEMTHTTKGNVIDEEAQKILAEVRSQLSEWNEQNPDATFEELFAKEEEIMSTILGKRSSQTQACSSANAKSVQADFISIDEFNAVKKLVVVQSNSLVQLQKMVRRLTRTLEKNGIDLDTESDEEGSHEDDDPGENQE